MAAGLLKYAAKLGGNPELLATSTGYAAFVVRGAGVVDRFRREVGNHCIQRVPPTERSGRRHTSFARVTATPMRTVAERPLALSEVELTFQKKGGKGGQHQNKTDSAVRARHIPTGISVFVNGRSQFSNRDRALQILAQRVQAQHTAAVGAAWSAIKSDQTAQLAKIRTYNFIDRRAVDHRTGNKVGCVAEVLAGGFDMLG